MIKYQIAGIIITIILTYFALNWLAEKEATAKYSDLKGGIAFEEINSSNMSEPPKQLSKICEFCLETNDTVYKTSGACKPCFV
ncbi:MAG: hypothetical protein ABIF85_05165 [Nanoarchaeota archaeon]|nr:hypothetical protein [Nanoarchaeota archaeon]MBU4452369.1 hypothetical protein [Nanoarchaeota archaeon]MCG2723355.1 hypothetical protein [archaeon]